MPNIITHKLFGEQAITALMKSTDPMKHEALRVIQKHAHLFYIGTNGPDVLFFHHAKPWESWKSHRLSKIGGSLHRGQVNDFYEAAITAIRKQEDPLIKERMVAYLMGHLCHWALDKTAHPYIFYRTGNCKGKSAYAHHRFESMMDAMMLRRYHNETIETYKAADIAAADREMLQAIARIYVPAVGSALHQKLTVHEIHEALLDWHEILLLLHDPTGKLCERLQKAEIRLHRKWMISGHIIPKDIDPRFDVLNLQKQTWYHPCTMRLSSNASVPEMFEEGIGVAAEAIKLAYQDICEESGFGLGNLLHDQAYDTGMDPSAKMKHFDLIYDDMD